MGHTFNLFLLITIVDSKWVNFHFPVQNSTLSTRAATKFYFNYHLTFWLYSQITDCILVKRLTQFARIQGVVLKCPVLSNNQKPKDIPFTMI